MVDLVALSDEIPDRQRALRQHREMSSGTRPETVTVRQPALGLSLSLSFVDLRHLRIRKLQKVDAIEERKDALGAEKFDMPANNKSQTKRFFHGEILQH